MSSVSPLEFPSEKTEKTVKLAKRLKDEFQLFQFVCFFFSPFTCLTDILQGCKRIVEDTLAPVFTPLCLHFAQA